MATIHRTLTGGALLTRELGSTEPDVVKAC